MAEVVKFTSTKLSGLNKSGVIKPDADGYYEMVIGGLNAYNSVGEYYTLEGAKQLFEESGALMRRLKNGCLKGEVGHPKQTPGMNSDAYLRRILAVEETNTCCFFKEIWLDPNYGRANPRFKNPNLVAIMARIKPAGVKGAALEAAFNNPGENVCFSIRALTKDFYNRGETFRVLTNIVTWDWVTEPGIAAANAFDSPALESMDETIITHARLKRAVDKICHDKLALESDRQIALEALASMEQAFTPPAAPLFKHW